MSAIGHRLRRWREEAGLSIYRLARQAGLHPDTVQRLEQGEDAKVSTWLKVLGALHRQPEELWAGIRIEIGMEAPSGERPKEPGETERRILDRLSKGGGEFIGPVARLAGWIRRSKRETWKGLRNLLAEGRIVKLAGQRGRGGGSWYALVGAKAKGGRTQP